MNLKTFYRPPHREPGTPLESPEPYLSITVIKLDKLYHILRILLLRFLMEFGTCACITHFYPS